ncbi:hypothetical protein [Sporosarcina saromensis]|uniref:Uncharacterized protein n=1 Tax=Sporosarcina saromensis TaxID=359365 RepID=A0ABU4G7T7_9BACL|nr:hypothetical protein [Sporosarcina saromensis]MDW0112427.1 hypothetical protein [Sporosarcina saromensis]
MMKIILGGLEKLDFSATAENIRVVESVEQLLKKNNDEITYFSTLTEENSNAVVRNPENVYIPATSLLESHKSLGLHIYFDLESYPFYQKVKEIISKEDQPKGVFRFRRTVQHDRNHSLLTGDLYTLSSLFGKPQDIRVKQTDQSVTPSHTIILMNFGGGTMAHIEYTVSDRERIELEWSGIKKIIEFDSDQMVSIQSTRKPAQPLAYSVDAILACAQKVDQELIDRLNDFSRLIDGGVYS